MYMYYNTYIYIFVFLINTAESKMSRDDMVSRSVISITEYVIQYEDRNPLNASLKLKC